jgi:hypothetical protein
MNPEETVSYGVNLIYLAQMRNKLSHKWNSVIHFNPMYSKTALKNYEYSEWGDASSWQSFLWRSGRDWYVTNIIVPLTGRYCFSDIKRFLIWSFQLRKFRDAFINFWQVPDMKHFPPPQSWMPSVPIRVRVLTGLTGMKGTVRGPRRAHRTPTRLGRGAGPFSWTATLAWQ